MPDKLQVTIIGLGVIGASAGLALKRYPDKVVVVGHDRSPEVASLARKAGAVDRTEWNLINAVTGADRILLALPSSEIKDTLGVIASELKPGCVLLDTADVKAPVLRWAAETLPAQAQLVGGHPILLIDPVDADSARADLFQDKLFCLTASGGANDQAMRLAADLVEALGAKPFFMDPAEHDGLVAAVEHLPQAVAGALLHATSSSPSWQDLRKLAGSQFYAATFLGAADGKGIAAGLLANRDNVIHWLDRLMAELGEWRQQLADGDEAGLAETLDHGLEAGRRWVAAQERGIWEETAAAAPMPDKGSTMRQLLGLGRLGMPKEQPKRK